MKVENGKNLGVCLLRMLMCFEVVLCHFWLDMDYSFVLKPFNMLKNYAVPIFMLMSFFLTQKSLLLKDLRHGKKRLWRLIWPLVGWAVIYWSVYMLEEVLCGKERVNGGYDLLWQVFTGHSPNINPSMWYQTVLILLTLFFMLIFYFFSQKVGIFVCCVIAIISLMLQYSGSNYAFFSGLRYELMYPLGRMSEMVPYAVLGFCLAYYGIYKRYNGLTLICTGGAAVGLSIVLKMILPVEQGYGYSGVLKIGISFFILTIVMILPFDSLSEKYRSMIMQMSRFTLGIYCMHRLVGEFVTYLFIKIGLKTETFLLCCLVYVVSYAISYGFSKIPVKAIKQLLE